MTHKAPRRARNDDPRLRSRFFAVHRHRSSKRSRRAVVRSCSILVRVMVKHAMSYGAVNGTQYSSGQSYCERVADKLVVATERGRAR